QGGWRHGRAPGRRPVTLRQLSRLGRRAVEEPACAQGRPHLLDRSGGSAASAPPVGRPARPPAHRPRYSVCDGVLAPATHRRPRSTHGFRGAPLAQPPLPRFLRIDRSAQSRPRRPPRRAGERAVFHWPWPGSGATAGHRQRPRTPRPGPGRGRATHPPGTSRPAGDGFCPAAGVPQIPRRPASSPAGGPGQPHHQADPVRGRALLDRADGAGGHGAPTDGDCPRILLEPESGRPPRTGLSVSGRLLARYGEVMRKASILLATAALLGAACTTAPDHLTGGNGPGTTSAGSMTIRLQLRAAVKAEPQARPSLAPIIRVPLSSPAPQSRPAQPSPSAAPATGPTENSSPSPASPPTDRCLGSPTANPHQPEPMCAVP